MEVSLSNGMIRLRQYSDIDVDALRVAVSSSMGELSAWVSWFHPDHSRSDSEAFFRARPAEWEKGEPRSFVIAGAVPHMPSCIRPWRPILKVELPSARLEKPATLDVTCASAPARVTKAA